MTETEKKMAAVRKKIDRADRQILAALAARMDAVREIGAIKIAAGLPLQQKTRWSDLMRARLQLAGELGLNRRAVSQIYERIHAEALRLQRALAREKK